MNSSAELTQRLQQEAQRLGFTLSGVCQAEEAAGAERLGEWLQRGYAGGMEYLERRQAAYSHPRHVLEGVRSLLMLGMHYQSQPPRAPQPGEGRISRYAWGESDYHDVIHAKLKQLSAFFKQLRPEANVRGVVDTAPLLEREFAQKAGLGWIGKHTLLLNRQAGSWFFLAALLTDQELTEDAPFTTDHCGTCQACLDVCPTDAFVQPYVLDASRCISYLTIELREPIPQDLREGVGDWLFGCDLCQEVCPWNRKSPVSEEAAFAPRENTNPIALAEMFFWDDETFRQHFRKTPLWRSKRRGILRNAAIVLGNQRRVEALPALVRGLEDVEPLIRGASAWALGRLSPNEQAEEALKGQGQEETDEYVSGEIAAALAQEV